MNPINTAILQEDFSTAQQLLDQGEAWDLTDFMAAQAYERLLKNQQFELLQCFIDKQHINLDLFEYDNFNNSLFELLTQQPCTDAFLAFLDNLLPQVENIEEDIADMTWLGLALQNKSELPFLEKLIEHGCDVQYKNNNDQSVLFQTNDVALCQFLMDQGVDVNAKDNGGNTILMNAVAQNNAELVQLYLDAGADTNHQNNKGETAYHIAVFNAMSIDRYQQLSNYDPPRFDQVNTQGQSLFFQFVESSDLSWAPQLELFKLMINDGADLFQAEKNAYGEEKTVAQLLATKDISIFEILLQQDDFNPNQQDNAGNTWLHYVCRENLNFEQSKAKTFYQKIKRLIQAGADVSIRNDQDQTPADLASDDNLKAKGLALLLKQ